MGPLDDLMQALREEMKKQVPVQTIWAKVESVSAETMTVVDADEPDVKYFKVLLGLGHEIKKPAVGSKVLIGVIENQANSKFLIYAEKLDTITWRNGTYGGLLKADNVAARLQEHESKVNALIDYISALPVPVSGAVSGPPVPLPYAAFKLTQTESSALQNTAIKHG